MNTNVNSDTVSKNKGLSKFDIIGLVIGSVVGWGAFILPGTLFLPNSGVLSTMIGLFIGSIFIVIIQGAYKVMLSQHSENGGEFSYTLQNMGKVHGFIVGWSLSLCYLSLVPLNATAYALIMHKIFGDAILCGYLYNFGANQVFLVDILIATVPIIVFSIINLRGISVSVKVQNIMSMALVVIVVVLFFIVLRESDLHVFSQNYLGYSKISFVQIAPVIAIVPFLFVGFDVVPQVSEDLNFHSSKAHIPTILSIIFGLCIYNLLNLIAGLSYSSTEAASVDWAVASSVLDKAGKVGFSFLILAIFSAVTGGINGFMISSSKLLASLAEYKLCPNFLCKKNNRGVYVNAILFIAVISFMSLWIGREVIILIVDMASVLAGIAYTYVGFIGIKKAGRLFEKILCISSFAIGIGFIVLLLIPGSPAQLSKTSFLLLMVWAVLGILFFIFTTKNHRR